MGLIAAGRRRYVALQKHKLSLSEEQWGALSAESKRKHTSVSALVRELVEDWLMGLRKEAKEND